MTNRRNFLAALAGAATLDPERLLWVPGRKLISIPARPRSIAMMEIWIGGKHYRIAETRCFSEVLVMTGAGADLSKVSVSLSIDRPHKQQKPPTPKRQGQ